MLTAINNVLQDTFWHKLPSLYATIIIMYFSLPLAIVAGYFCHEASGGHFDSLLTLPGVEIKHCAAAWAITCGLLMLFPYLAIWALFHVIQSYSASFIPALAMLLMGLAMGKCSTDFVLCVIHFCSPSCNNSLVGYQAVGGDCFGYSNCYLPCYAAWNVVL